MNMKKMQLMFQNAAEENVRSIRAYVTELKERVAKLQYQKQLRLLEARHLLVAGQANAETAAYRVGYESPSQFSREYTRMFGASPRRA